MIAFATKFWIARVNYGKIGETVINRICCSDQDSKLFSTAVELGSTKAMFCGHDHYNNQSLEYKGIRLSYGYSIDYLVMPGIANDFEQRGGTLITIDKKGDFEMEHVANAPRFGAGEVRGIEYIIEYL